MLLHFAMYRPEEIPAGGRGLAAAMHTDRAHEQVEGREDGHQQENTGMPRRLPSHGQTQPVRANQELEFHLLQQVLPGG